MTTGTTGGGQPFENLQPSQVVTYGIRIGGTSSELGEVAMFATGFVPQGWATAEGQLLSIASNPDLFALLGNSFGGDAINTFALPDLRGRVPIGTGQGPGLPNYQLGERAGSEQVTLAAAPVHAHQFGSGLFTDNSEPNQPHSNMQPSLALTPIIAATGQFPSRNAPVADSEIAGAGLPGAEPFLGEVTWIAHDEIPAGWLRADGATLDISENVALFSLLGDIYGGDGRTNFKLPDLRGRAIMGQGQGPGQPNHPWGEAIGEHEETLFASRMPQHTHTLPDGLGETVATGGGLPQSNLQPTVVLTPQIAVEGVYPSAPAPEAADEDTPVGAVGGSTEPWQGSITMFAGSFAIRGFATAESQLLPISQNKALFSLIGTTYGGDGQNSFGLPDLRGRIGVGMGTGPGLTPRTIGAKFGEEATALTIDNLPPHSHTYTVPGDYNDDGTVDAADYTVWRDNVGEDSSTLPNAISPGIVGQDHYDDWRNNYGATALTPPPALGATAPEPASVLIAALALGLTHFSLRRREHG